MAEADGVVTGVQRQVRHRSLLTATSALLMAVGVAYGIRRGEWFFLFYGLWGAGSLAMSWRPPTQVTAAGVRRPWRRVGFVPWPDVALVIAPQIGLTAMRLELTDGRKLPLDDIPAARCAEVAAIGGKEMVRPALPTVRSGPPPPPRPRPDDHGLADVSRQAQALARQRAELAALSRRLKP